LFKERACKHRFYSVREERQCARKCGQLAGAHAPFCTGDGHSSEGMHTAPAQPTFLESTRSLAETTAASARCTASSSTVHSAVRFLLIVGMGVI